ncbi:hypothetical protein CN917_27355 [Bacillus thuringiensis]|uniref:Uncharacterized protein n=1 Tax=Bacillus thuringiensis TaxID=1428 RepID=A0A9X7BI84_BACTU|nr:hypothetical protein IE9_05262 [Bacillus cereus BAG4X12-1]EOP78248.1 hypothetical protein IEG_05132 [Bacillus cereus BAG5X12-1]EPF08955.1 hypothetical protein ICA_05056 [Bacillus cereus BAG1O-3]MBV6708771.1 hypothetical protein [Bacillus thuringiensis]OBW85033.1 hypothetical protein A9L49_29565 [Bacillus cereus]OHO75758.1 hypothetical protein HMPREF2590_12110 [Bacillus sp. HMSC036E02]PFG78917.1 hypothetical protein DL97_2588 [Bacillus sp. YF23]
MYCKEEQSDSERNKFLPFCLGGVTVKTIEIKIVRSGSRKDLKMELDKVVKKFRSKGLEVVVQYRTQAIVNGIEYSASIIGCKSE